MLRPLNLIENRHDEIVCFKMGPSDTKNALKIVELGLPFAVLITVPNRPRASFLF